MKQMKSLLTLLIVSICAVQGVWADRSAPELPVAQTLESGQTYYLYNVIEGKFLCRSTTNSSSPAIGTYGDQVTITATANDDEYTIQWTSNSYYWYAQDTNVGSTSSKNSKTSLFTITESAQGYTIQRSATNTSYYKADEFIGYNGSNGDRLNPTLTVGSIQWQLMSVEEAEYYFAKHKLYTYLESADSYNFYVTQYDEIYNNTSSTTAALNQAQETLQNALELSTNYVSPAWTDYPILLQNGNENQWRKYSNNTLQWREDGAGVTETSTLTATVNVDENVTFIFTCWTGNGYSNFRVYLDDVLVQTISNNQCKDSQRKHRSYVEMRAGKHDIKLECQLLDTRPSGPAYESYITEIGVQKSPIMMPATTTVEGQLGTEVLKLTDNVANVKKIIINGIIGADDWTTIGMMVNALEIDLSGATAVAGIPASTFTGDKFPFLHSFKMPRGLTEIGERAFYQSDIENEIIFPATLQSIGNYAFSGSKIEAAHLPEGINSVEMCAFDYCYFLEQVTWPSTATTIPWGCFRDCYNLRTFTIPEGVTDIEEIAFYYCKQFNARFPQSLKTIKRNAFDYSGIDRLILPEKVDCYEAFHYCNNLVYAEFPTSYTYPKNQSGDKYSPVRGCTKLKDIYFKAPAVVKSYDRFFTDCTAEDLTIHVPSFLVSAYKLDPYWYNYNPVGFSTTDVADWNFADNISVVLQAGERLEGAPNVIMNGGTSFVINGDDAMTLNDFTTYVNGNTANTRAMIISNTNNVTINGTYTYNYYTDAKSWYFLCLPFDVKVSNITSPGCSHVVRYYDGATRAANGTGSNWKNYASDAVIPAGTGFIYQTSAACWNKFVAENNTSKNYVFSCNEFVKTLEANPSEVAANIGWNLVGNPWLSYYNIHKLNFTAPITVWNRKNNRYDAYSIIDDDYAIEPAQAIFVQCSDELNTISFPIDGRQLTNVIESQNGVRRFGASEEPERKLIDIELSNGELSDKTRFVLNPQAKMAYETCCDASKFFSMDSNTPQIYTIQDGVQMAINERPAGDGVVHLGVVIPVRGTYTIMADRNMLTGAVLVDLQNGTETNLSTASYVFSAETGIMDNRFELHLAAKDVTGIYSLHDVQSKTEGKDNCYNLNGQRVTAPQKGICIVNGKKVIMK